MAAEGFGSFKDKHRSAGSPIRSGTTIEGHGNDKFQMVAGLVDNR